MGYRSDRLFRGAVSMYSSRFGNILARKLARQDLQQGTRPFIFLSCESYVRLITIRMRLGSVINTGPCLR